MRCWLVWLLGARAWLVGLLGLVYTGLQPLPVLAQPLAAVATPVAPAVTPSPTRRPVIGLVLSGGGARGMAHLGVLRALEEARVPVDLVVGTSMGAIVGGLYASGMAPEALTQELSGIPWATLFDRRAPRPTLPQRRKENDFELSPVIEIGFRDGEFRIPTGAVSTRSLEWLLRRLTLPTRELSDFNALPTPFRAVATDMETGEPVTLDRGDLAAALRASMSVPGVFAPLEWEQRILGDGGLVNNLPVDVARAMGAQVVIAVNIGSPLAGRERLNSVLGISEQMINILTEQNVQRSVASLTPNDLLLAPQLGPITSSDFDRAADIVQIGLDYGRSISAALARFSVSAEAYAQWQLARQPLAAPPPGSLAFVRFDGVRPAQASHLARLVTTQADSPLNPAQLQADLLQLSASGDYDHVDYRLEPDAATRTDGLVFDLKENQWGPNYVRAGLDLHTNFAGDSAFNLRVSHSRHWLTEQGTEWRNQVEIGAITALRTELYQPLGGEKDRFFSLHAQTRSERVELFAPDGDPLASYNRLTRTVGLDHGWTLGRGGHLGNAVLGLFGRYRSVDSPLVNPYALTQLPDVQTDPNGRESWTEGGVRLRLVTDQLDQANFARQGHRVALEAEWGQRRAGAEREAFHRIEGSGNLVASWGDHTWGVLVRAAKATNIPAGALDEYSLGGFQQLSGFKPGQVVGNNLALARIGYHRRLGIKPTLARGYYVGGSLEWGNAWANSTDLRWAGVKRAASLFLAADTGLGPAYLALVKGQGQTPGIYLFLGRP